MKEKPDHTSVDIQVTAKKDELSLKAKGAGLLVLIAICLVGIVLLGLKMVDSEKGGFLIMPIMILSYITYSLIATLDAVLGLRVRYHDD
ncbi:MAG: hypothetical protein D6732_28600 [Methanobacteriota archaeon]|nr:MAG: hypothetical protein D6732_28600 [Euryarchaeota archaeon]